MTVTSPTANATVAGTVTLTAAASDNVAVLGVQFYVDGAPVGTEDTSAPYSRTWTSTAQLNGAYVVTAVARDAAGNTRTSAGVTIGLKNLGSGVPGDLDDDGRADLLFQHTTGSLHTWLLNGAGGMTSEGPVTPGGVNPVWQVAAVDDFDGDKKSDILWQHTATGQLYLWSLDRRTLIAEGFVSQNSTPWRVLTTGDFNRDGSTDILWMSPSGSLALWYMLGTTMASSVTFGPGAIDPSWRLAGTGDFNRDGNVDLLWQNRATGDIHTWMMGGTTVLWSGPLTPGATNPVWEVRAVLDLDRDGDVDLLFQHTTTGQLYTWSLTGTTLVRDGFFSPSQIDPSWQVVGQR